MVCVLLSDGKAKRMNRPNGPRVLGAILKRGTYGRVAHTHSNNNGIYYAIVHIDFVAFSRKKATARARE